MLEPRASDDPGRGFNRRRFLSGAASLAGAFAAGGGVLGLGGCAVGDDATAVGGGTLRLGMSGGSTSDSLDPRTFVDFVPINIGYQLMNGLVEIDGAGNATPELFESWEPRTGAAEWIFNVRGDVTFHNGKTLDADDVIYSLNLHRGETRSASKIVLENITAIRKLGERQLQINLAAGDADLPATLSDYRVLVVPDGFTDWTHPIGTGGYRLESFEPGVRCLTTKTGYYWKANAGHVEGIEIIVINDAMARINALISNQVDAISRIDGRTADLFKRNRRFQVVRSQTGQYAVLAMDCEAEPYRNNDIRLALKAAIDRESILKTVLNGYGQVGNDQPIPAGNKYYSAGLPQHSYDPDRARFHLKRAGREGLKVSLQVSEAAFSGAVDAAIFFQSAAARAGISLEVRREPADGYWSNVWHKAPFCASYSDGRPTVDAMLTKAYRSMSSLNETNWHRPQFDRLADQARAELDTARRRELYAQCQRMICEDGGAIIPMFMDHIEAGSQRIKGWKPSAIFDLMGQRIGEKVWLEGVKRE
jgi:peptide/nickel transport system substrate-binding protein